MPFWFPPPPPTIVSATGAQPSAQGLTSPGIPGRSVDQPGFIRDKLDQSQALIIGSWQVDPWQYTYLGGGLGRQPYGPETAPPSTLGVAPAYIPPPDNWVPGVLASWQSVDPLPQLPRYVPQFQIPAYIPLPDNWLPGVLAAWQPADPPPQQGRFFTPPTVNPPSGVGVPKIVTVDDPPLPQTSPKLVQPAAATVTAYIPNVPVWLATVLGLWQPSDPPPQQQGKLSPAIPGQSVDQPSPRQPTAPPSVPQADPLPQQTKYLVQPAVATTGYIPPPDNWVPGVLASWQPPDPPPQQQGRFVTSSAVYSPPPGVGVPKIVITPDDPPPQQSGKIAPFATTAAVVNNPPFGNKGFNTWSWGEAQVVSLSGGDFIQSVDNPPIQTPGGDWLSIVLNTWVPGPPQPQTLGPFLVTQTVVVVNNPPFNYAGRSPVFNDIVRAWLPGPPQPQTLGPFLTSSAVYSPPPGVGVPKIVTVDDPPLPQTSGKVAAIIPFTPPVVNNPPGFRFELSGILGAWQPPDPQPQRLPPFVTASAVYSNPPGVGVPKIVTVDDPPLPQVSGKIAAVIPFVAPIVNNPPFNNRQFYTWSWGEAQVVSLSGGDFIQSVDNPPIQTPGGDWLSSVLTSWLPGPPQPQQLPPFVTLSAVYSPPPGVGVVRIITIDDPPLPQVSPKIAGMLPPPAPSTELHDHPFFATFGKMTVR